MSKFAPKSYAEAKEYRDAKRANKPLERQLQPKRRGLRARPKKTLHASTMWSQDIKERDGYICQRCGVYSKQNHAHHVAPRSRRPDLKFDRQNGVTLCAGCHSWVHDNPIESTEAGLLSDETYEKSAKARA